MNEKDFKRLLKLIFENFFDLGELYKIEILKKGKIKIKYSSSYYPNLMVDETIKLNEEFFKKGR